jgi:hypothetical protein
LLNEQFKDELKGRVFQAEVAMSIDWAKFIKNRSAIPLEELDRFAGQWVAWSPDGTHIVAGSSESEEALWRQLEAAGHNSFDFVFGYIPAPDELNLGALSLPGQPPVPDRGSGSGT